MVPELQLNRRAAELWRAMARDAVALRVAVSELPCGAQVIDCGVVAHGGLEAGRRLAEICLAGLGSVSFTPGDPNLWPGWSVSVATDQPVCVCMASQYAGWQVFVGKYFAMASGPMRALAGHEAVLEKFHLCESSDVAVGVLETGKLPPNEVCEEIARKCGLPPKSLLLLAAATRSQAGDVQVVARTVETALHKLFELGFDLTRIESGLGRAPLPPVAANDIAGIGRTNDAILYGGEVTLFVRGDDESLRQIGPQVPSCASADYGRPFAQIFASYDHDFYKIDPHLFSPAVVTFSNLDTGRTFRFGHLLPRVIHESFGAE